LGAITLADNAYLKRRCGKGRSGYRWYARVPVPKDLHDALGKRWIERSLNTSDIAIARQRKLPVLIEIFESFERARRGGITSGDIEHEAQLFLQERFNALQKRADDTCAPDVDALGNEMQPLAERALFELHAMQQEEDWPPLIEQAAEKIAKQYGTTLGPTQRDELCRALLHGEIEAHSRVIGAKNSEILKPVSVLNARAVDPITAEVARPKGPSPKKGTALRVSEAAATYLADRNREKKSRWTEQTRNQAETTLRLFADATKDAQIDTISRREVADFLNKIASLDKNYGRHAMKKLSLDVLLEKYLAKDEGLSNRTLNRHCSVLAGMFEWAIKAGRLEGANPAKGHFRKIASDHEASEGRRAFTTDELNKLLGGPIFSASYEERVSPPRHTPNATLSWLIPIALFSGMRLDEICGLRTEDVAEEAGILFFNLVSHKGRRLKTAAARRRVPVHSELLRIGIGDYLTNIRHQRHIYLFPGLKPARLDGKRSAYVGKRFVEYRRSVGVSDPNTTFHCMRKNAATALQRARIPESEAAEVLGHKKMTMTYGLYSEGLELRGHREVVEAISYPGLDLSQLHAQKDRSSRTEETARTAPSV
jgi:integrase